MKRCIGEDLETAPTALLRETVVGRFVVKQGVDRCVVSGHQKNKTVNMTNFECAALKKKFEESQLKRGRRTWWTFEAHIQRFRK